MLRAVMTTVRSVARMVLQLALSLGVASCSGNSLSFHGTFSCGGLTETEDGGAAPKVCIEGTGGKNSDVAEHRDECRYPAFFIEQECVRTGVVGGCQQKSAGVTLTTWYYSDRGFTTEDVKAVCLADDTDFVKP